MVFCVSLIRRWQTIEASEHSHFSAAQVAARLGFKDSPNLPAPELFMREFYLLAAEAARILRLLIAS